MTIIFHIFKNTEYQDPLTLHEFIDMQPESEIVDGNTVSEEIDPDWEAIYGSETLAILAESCGYEFQKEQMEQSSRVLVRIDIPKDRMSGSMLFGRQFYLREKYAALNVESAKKIQNGEMPIKNRFKYFLRMLEDDAFQPAAY